MQVPSDAGNQFDKRRIDKMVLQFVADRAAEADNAMDTEPLMQCCSHENNHLRGHLVSGSHSNYCLTNLLCRLLDYNMSVSIL